MAIEPPTGALGDLLRAYREQHGLNQAELAARAVPPLSAETVSNVQRGRTRPYRHTVQAVCRALELDDAALASVWAAWEALVRARVPLGTAQSGNHFVRAGDLPAQATELVGRERETQALSVRVLDQDTRLLTLVGPGGVGKTRLALAASWLPARA